MYTTIYVYSVLRTWAWRAEDAGFSPQPGRGHTAAPLCYISVYIYIYIYIYSQILMAYLYIVILVI